MLTFEYQPFPDRKWSQCRAPSEKAARITPNSFEGYYSAFELRINSQVRKQKKLVQKQLLAAT